MILTLKVFRMLFVLCTLLQVFMSPARAEEPSSAPENWNAHFQATTVTQGHGALNAPYTGNLSLSPAYENMTSVTSTAFMGVRAWQGAQVYVNPEVSGGAGLSQSHGIAGFPNGEIYRVDDPAPKVNLSRLYLQQVFGLGGGTQTIESDKNQLAGGVDQRRITVVAGKFSLNDFFDSNSYAHDPRSQFLNWALMDNGAWDYAADTRGYTWGFMVEYNEPKWALRFASVMEPMEANQMVMDPNIGQAHGDNLEFEYRYEVSSHPGIARVLGFMNHAHMGSYRETIDNPGLGMDVTQTRQYRLKYGAGLNFEQEISPNLGAFMRMGWNDGATETWAFTEIDRTISVGASLNGRLWNRPSDVGGVALIVNGLSKDHADYLSSGGYGFIVGDSQLNYAPEQIIEGYYLYKVLRQVALTADVQFVNHPGYNADRGPATIFAMRTHLEF